MKKFPFRIIIPPIDQAMITLSFIFFYWLSFKSGLSPYKEYYPFKYYIIPCIIINIFWLLLFALFGLYGKWKNTSRFDEIISVYKTITVGAVVFLIFSFWISHDISYSKLPVLGYWASLVILVGFGRLFVRTVQRYLLSKGVNLRPSIVVGSKRLAEDMLNKLRIYPALGYDIKGVILTEQDNHHKEIAGFKVLGSVVDIHSVIGKYGISDMLIALEFKEEEEIFRLISAADSFDVDFSIMPGPSDVLAGRVMYNHIYGFPMIRILSEPMPPWEKNVKRIIDISLSLIVLIFFLPLFLIIAAAIKLDSKGKVFYSQERVGFRGSIFRVYKFRSMLENAEKTSGPVWAGENDPRITRVGKILRKMRLDELPQMFNILNGDMSLVGPRPERPFFVEQLKIRIPYYPLRLKIKPGLTGWAQIKHSYDSSLDDVKEKLKYDLYYIENMSLNMDFKIIISTVFVVISRKGAR